MRRLQIAILAAFCVTAAATSLAQKPPTTPVPAPAAAPAPAPTPAPPSASALKDGKALFARVVENLGGKEKVAKIHDMQTRGQVTTKGSQGDMSMDMQTYVVFPDHLSQQVDAPFGRLVMVATPAGAFVVGPQGTQDLPPDLRDDLLHQILRTSLYLAQKGEDPKFSAATAGVEKIGEVEARILDITYDDVRVRWFVDPKIGRILRSSHVTKGPDQREMPIQTDYSDFRVVDGYTIPFHLEVNTSGKKDQTLKVEELKINAGIDPRLFEKPPAPTQAPAAQPTPAP
jgi:hypothetical protein